MLIVLVFMIFIVLLCNIYGRLRVCLLVVGG